ncbi:UvrD-helicase domain-containing protein [Luteimonas dalianensis]|uniref:UvrD-helicase domain-containing protein n=1 Tax=Luteimonas dalianensis TaxID=1148196 RepID=UPI003BF1A13D
MNKPYSTADDDADRAADVEITACLDPAAPKSFFLFAGAGSGKTRSLVSALEHIQDAWGVSLRPRGQRVGVITYTNAACDEIIRRVSFDPLFDVRTIHSFAWSLIEGLDNDIRAWLTTYLAAEIEELHRLEARGRAGKASDDRKAKIASYGKRLELLPGIKRFIYSPTGTNRTRDSLNHAEVIKLTSHFLTEKTRMRAIFVGRYPILLVDESQDTNAALVDALFRVEAEHKGTFSLGLIGDMMQRIYADGKEDLGRDLPPAWMKPRKMMNHRCPIRIVSLLNKIRRAADDHEQTPRTDAPEGIVRLFVFPADHAEKFALEDRVMRTMAELTEDALWEVPGTVKTLTLEHRMAARRLGCLDAFGALYDLDSQSLLSGSQRVATFFTEQVLPIVEAKRDGDRFALMRSLKAHSPLLSSEALQANPGRAHLATVQGAVDSLYALWDNETDPTLLIVLRQIASSKLLEIPDRLIAWVAEEADQNDMEAADDGEQEDEATRRRIEVIDRLLATSFSQVAPLREYLAGRARFDTHQGVKGLEFDRVMVIMDDTEARGFMFKYEDLFGGKTEGKVLEATRRLFYVTASRARKSLALVAYSSAPERVKHFVLDQGWFSKDEIIENLTR